MGASTAIPAAVAPTAAAIPGAAAPNAAATIASAAPALAVTAALRERTKMAAGEKRARARTLSLAKRREGSVLGSPETLQMTEMETTLELDISLDLQDREIVLSSPPRDEGFMTHEEKEEVPLFKKQRYKKMTTGSDLEKLEPALKPETQPPALSEEEIRERDEELERIADRFVNTLNATCSKKKEDSFFLLENFLNIFLCFYGKDSCVHPKDNC
jgi:hypothetical protein